MTDKAVWACDYTDMRFVKSRKVTQIVLEFPIERAAEFVAAFGAPSPATGVPVAIARLVEGKACAPTPAPPIEKECKPFSSLPPAQQAALRCNEPTFRQFLARDCDAISVFDLDTAADEVRAICEVSSRSELNTNDAAAARWRNLDDEYFRWQRGVGIR